MIGGLGITITTDCRPVGYVWHVYISIAQRSTIVCDFECVIGALGATIASVCRPMNEFIHFSRVIVIFLQASEFTRGDDIV